MEDYTGRQLGDYRVAETIGAGGMGKVYLAEQVHLRKHYALKVLPEVLAADGGFVDRFYDEARVMAELHHPGIVQVHTMGCDQGAYFLVMDYVGGPQGRPMSLHDFLAGQPEGRLNEAQAGRFARQIAEALAYAHKRGVIHRDIKPANILIDQEGDARITDFGLAKAIGNEFILAQIHESMQQAGGGRPRAAEGTISGQATVISPASPASPPSDSSGILGTYDYMAPEQRGEGGQIDQRTDIYAFGILVYRMLTGKRPVGFAKPPSQAVPGLSKKWDAIVSRCIADGQQDRYQSADELLAELKGVAGGSRKGLAVALVLVVAVVGVAAVLLGGKIPELLAGLSGDGREEDERREVVIVPDDGKGPETYTLGLADVVPVKTRAEMAMERFHTLDAYGGLADLLDEADAIKREADTYMSLEAYGEAKGAYERLLAKCNEISAIAGDRSDEIERLLALAAENNTQENAHLALEYLDRVLDMDPGNEEALDLYMAVQVNMDMLVVPDEFPTIQSAIDAADVGQTVYVSAGTYEEALVFKEGISLVGAGMYEVTVRQGALVDHPLWGEDCTSGVVSDMTFEHYGSDDSDSRYSPITLSNCSIEISRCRARNGAGHGIVVKDSGAPTISECVVEFNPWQGIYITGGASPKMLDNICRGNTETGINFGDDSGGEARGNTCEENTFAGIAVGGQGASPLIVNNTCSNNEQSGIYIYGGAAGIAEGNTCEGNAFDGIAVAQGGTAPQLRNNICRSNVQAGISYASGAAGVAKNNTCEYNTYSGITVGEAGTAPELRDNVLRANEQSGIYYYSGSGGSAVGNTCEGNAFDGIACSGEGTSPRLSRNECNDNGEWGIDVYNDATPTIDSNNSASGNGEGQIRGIDETTGDWGKG